MVAGIRRPVVFTRKPPQLPTTTADSASCSVSRGRRRDRGSTQRTNSSPTQARLVGRAWVSFQPQAAPHRHWNRCGTDGHWRDCLCYIWFEWSTISRTAGYNHSSYGPANHSYGPANHNYSPADHNDHGSPDHGSPDDNHLGTSYTDDR